MRIVICDDDALALQTLENDIRQFMADKDIGYSLLTYDHSQQLNFDLEDTAAADVYILDIDMPIVGGIDIALRIKSMCPRAMVFFYTSHSEFATQGYRMGVRRYILKQDMHESLEEAMNYAYREFISAKKNTISLFNAHDTINLPISEILYVERDNRRLKITAQGCKTYYDTRSIKEFQKKLNDPTFILVDKGVLIHIDFVFKTENNTVTMFDQNTFTISRRRMREVKELIMRYWKEV